MYGSTTHNRKWSGLISVLSQRPDAFAILNGSEEYPAISGRVFFYETKEGVIVAAEARGLPTEEGSCSDGIFGFHIHGGGSCTGTPEEPFSDAGEHYNPEHCRHPEHAGDLPPLFENRGFALSVFLTDRFTVGEILGKTVIVHSAPDDFHTQPGGNAGKRIACGEIRK